MAHRALGRLVAASLAVPALLLTACSQPADHAAPRAAGATASPSRTATPSVPPRSLLSGRPGADGRTLVVKVENTRAARPQIGLREADVVYVEEVEAGLNRLAAVYSSTLPERVGPVRSARISDLQLLAQYGRPAFAYSGAQTRLRPAIASAPLVDVGAERGPLGWSRLRSRRAPHNLVAAPKVLLSRRGQAATRTRDVGFRFGPAPAGGTPTSSVTVRYSESSVSATWSATAKAWLLSFDGRPAAAAEGGRLSTPTLLVQYCRITASAFQDKNGVVTPETQTVGSGKAVLLRDGKAWDVDWVRPSAGQGTRWLIGGADAGLAAGGVWVVLADASRPAVLR